MNAALAARQAAPPRPQAMDGCIHNQTVHASILRRGSSACPTSDWMEAVAALTPSPDAPVYINVGANKGYSALEFLSLWTAHRVSGQRWKRVVFSYKGGGGSLKQRACGNCKDCQRPLPAPHDRRGGRAYLLEMTAGNRGLLRHVLNETGLAASATVSAARPEPRRRSMPSRSLLLRTGCGRCTTWLRPTRAA